MKKTNFNLTILLICLLVSFLQCSKDNIEPRGLIMGKVNGSTKDYFKSRTNKVFKPFGEIKLNPIENTFCKSEEIAIRFGFKDGRESRFDGGEQINIYIPKSELKEGNLKITSETKDCTKPQTVSLYTIFFEDPPFIYYTLNDEKENFVKILKIDRQKKFIEGKFQLNYKIVGRIPNGYNENLDFNEGYFKIYYNIEI